MLLRYFETWLGRGLWLFLLMLVVATNVMSHVTGISPLSDLSDKGDYLLLVAGISLIISGLTLIFGKPRL